MYNCPHLDAIHAGPSKEVPNTEHPILAGAARSHRIVPDVGQFNCQALVPSPVPLDPNPTQNQSKIKIQVQLGLG